MGEPLKVLIATKLDPVARDLMTQAGFSVDVDESVTPESLTAKIAPYHGLMVRSDKVTAAVIAAADNLRIIVRAGSGVNTIDVEAATARNILVCNTPSANSNSVAELIFGYMLSLARNLTAAHTSTQAGEWNKKLLMGSELAGCTLGIIGLGNIGSRLIPKARGFDMNVVAFDPVVSPEHAKSLGVTLMPLDELVAASNFLTVHVPLTPSTKGMLTAELLQSAPEGAVFMNASRAEVVTEEDLQTLMKKRSDIRLAVDLFHEGDKPGDKSLAQHKERVQMSPHIGASTRDANFRAAKQGAEEIVELFANGIIANPVNMIRIPAALGASHMALATSVGKIAASMVAAKGQLTEIRQTCYGGLFEHSSILVKSGVMGVLDAFGDEVVTPTGAEAIAGEKGVKIVLREPDDDKGHGESVTLDVIVRADDQLKSTSVRGTINADGQAVIRRIDHFEDIDIFPTGNLTIFTYEDRTGVSGTIGDLFSKADINILDGRYKTSSDGELAIAILKTAEPVPAETVTDIQQNIQSRRAFSLELS
jgi:D-3-phosphoglycerate dehydrogenase / 2-oxoglutarate reductase